MTPESWQRIKGILNDALDLPAPQRPAFVVMACGSDTHLSAEVTSLLAAAAEVGDEFIEQPAVRLLDVSPASEDGYPAGQRIGRYRVLRRLGRGGMGDVYLAGRADAEFEQTVALKVVHRGMDTDEILRRFRQERQILANLTHPGIAALLDGGTSDDGLSYFVMEYVEGSPIDRYCQEQGLPERRRLDLFLEVCGAVHFAHQNLVVHRDLKPANILVTGGGQAKLLDFGIAKLLAGDGPQSTQVLMPGARLLTPRFASPEQLEGAQITTATDVYGLGLLLHLILTGALPPRLEAAVTRDAGASAVRNTSAASAHDAESSPSRGAGNSPAGGAGSLPSDGSGRLPAGGARSSPAGSGSGEIWPSGDARNAAVTAEADARTAAGSGQASAESLQSRTPQPAVIALRGDLLNVVEMAVRREPSRRYGSAQALADDVRRYVDGLPVLARRDSWSYRTRKFVGRHRASVAAAALLAALVVAFGITATVLWRQALRQEQKAKEVSSFLTDLLTSSDPTVALSPKTTAREVLDRALPKIESRLSAQPEIKADLVTTMGTAYLNLGLYDQALPLYQQALALRRQALGDDHPLVAESLEGIGDAYMQRYDYKDAGPYLQAGLEIQRRRKNGGDLEIARGMTNYAVYLEKMGRRADAERLYRELLARKSSNRIAARDLATAENNLSQMLEKSGDYKVAETLARDALALRRRIFGNIHPDVAASLNTLAMVREDQGDKADAERLYRENLALRQKLYGSSPLVARALNNFGKFYQGNGDYAAAESYIRQAVDMLQAAPETRTGLECGAVMRNLADVLAHRNPVEGERVAREALGILRDKKAAARIPDAESVLGGCLTAQGRYAAAEPLLLKGLSELQTGNDRIHTREAEARLVALYTAWKKPERAAIYQAMLAKNTA